MEKSCFADLCEKICPEVKVSDAHKWNAVPAEICLAPATLRTLAGGHWHDISDKFGFQSGSTFYHIFDKTLLAIDKLTFRWFILGLGDGTARFRVSSDVGLDLTT
jgi:hypothetical protein